MRARAGVTLLELTVVLAITAVAALLVVPWRTTAPDRVATDDALAALIADARRQAHRGQHVVTLRINRRAGRVLLDTAGDAGSAPWREAVLPAELAQALLGEAPLLTLAFHPGGAALGDPLRVRTADGVRTLVVDPLSGTLDRRGD